MKALWTANTFLTAALLLCACDGSVGNSDSCYGICQWNGDCMLSYFESESICETRCLNDEADGVNQDIWDEVRRCSARYREYYLCLELQECIDAISGLDDITKEPGGIDGDTENDQA